MGNLETVISAIDFIESHLNEKLDLDTVAHAVGYSKYHLHRIFTDTVRLTIHEYAQRRRLTEAAKLLVFSNKSIMDISLLAGYESQQAFTTIFKSMYKQSPHQYRENEGFYPLQLEFVFDSQTGISQKQQDIKREIFFATEDDVPAWMELARLVIDGFPAFVEQEHIETLEKCVEEKRAFIMKDGDLAIGIMAVSYQTGSIDFLGVHPLYRKQGITKLFLDKVAGELLKNKDISITTFREGDKADTGHRKELKALGFAEAELLVEFGYPTQKFILANQAGEEKQK